MEQKTLEYLAEQARALMEAGTSCKEAKEAAKAFLDAVGTDREAEEAAKLLKEAEEDIIPIDGLISFAESDAGKQVFGERAPEVAAHGKEIKAAGAVYCDCPACAACEAILAKKEEILK